MALKLGINLGYWGIGPRGEEALELVRAAEAAGFDSVWVADSGDGRVLRIDPRTGKTLWDENVAPGLIGIGAGPEAMWVTSAPEAKAFRIDMSSGSPGELSEHPVGPEPGGMGVGDKVVWVSSRTDNSVTAIPQNP